MTARNIKALLTVSIKCLKYINEVKVSYHGLGPAAGQREGGGDVGRVIKHWTGRIIQLESRETQVLQERNGQHERHLKLALLTFQL